MAFGSMGSGGKSLNSEINTTPLVDVMLVLLVVFILIAPVVTHRIKVNLPEVTTEKNQEKKETVTLAINGNGELFWNDAAISDDELLLRLSALGRDKPDTEFHIRADKTVTYERLAQVMAAAQNNGVIKLGFVTKPNTLQ